MKNYGQTLGVHPGSGQEEIKRAFRAMIFCPEGIGSFLFGKEGEAEKASPEGFRHGDF